VAEVRGFRGLQYVPARVGELSRVVCPPYDVISAAEAASLRAGSPYNAIHVELPEPEPGDATGHSRYRRAAETLSAWRRDGVLARDDTPTLYAVEETFAWQGQTHRRRGVLAAVRLANWDERVVLPHERTLAAPKADRLDLLRACETNLSPLFMLYPPQPDGEAALWRQLEALTPISDIHLPDERRERVWAVGEAGAALMAGLAGAPLYIADGHHRYETALRYRDERRAQRADSATRGYDYVLTYLVAMDHPGLLVLPTHRCLPAGRVDDAALDALLSERFEREPYGLDGSGALGGVLAEMARRADRRTTFALYRPGGLELLQPRPDASRWLPADRDAAWRALDVAQIESLLLGPLLGPAAAEDLTYTRDAAEAASLVDRGQAAYAVLLNPTRPEQIAAVADVGERMPQKSTYFYPKLSTGLVFHPLDDVAIA
jgi:uncharacterized protein (DUF1015 family)